MNTILNNKEKLKIVFLHRAKDPYTYERIKYFLSRGHKVYSIIFDLGEEKNGHHDFVQIKLQRNRLDKIPMVKRFIHYSELKRILHNINPDVLHIVNALNLFYLNDKSDFLKVVENQGSDVINTPNRFRLLIPYYKYMYKKTDAVIQDSKLAQEYGIKYGAPKENDRNQVIEIGIDFTIFNKDVPKGIIRKKYQLEDRKIIFHSRNVSDPIYNIDIVIRSLLKVREKYPDCILILTAVKVQLSSSLRDFIHKYDLEKNILFAGFQDRVKELKYFYRDADVNISVPSSDSSPFSVYESMACMTPNVVTDLPWLYYKFIPGKHLLVCSVRNEDSLAENILKVLNNNAQVDPNDAYNIVYEKINLIKENEKLEILYKNALKNKYRSHENM